MTVLPPPVVVAPPPVAVTATVATHVPKQPDSPWTEHTAPSGIKYYYNSVTKESTYSKPKDFGGISDHAKVNKVVEIKKNTPVSRWREYTDGRTGKKYYSDGKTTSWEKPAGFDSTNSPSKLSSSSSKRRSTSLSSSENNTSKPKKSKRKSSSSSDHHYSSHHNKSKEPTYSSKEEAIAAFKGLLLAKGITPFMKWADVFKICSEDYRDRKSVV